MVNLGPLDDYDPLPGLYGVVRTPGNGPRIIRWATRSWCDHAFVVVNFAGDIIEAEPDGVRLGNLREYAGCRVELNTGEHTTSSQRATVAAAAQAMIGKRYNDIAILNLGLETLGRHWQFLARIADGDHELICSQLVAICGQTAGLDWMCGASHPSEVTPAMLARRPGMTPWPTDM